MLERSALHILVSICELARPGFVLGMFGHQRNTHKEKGQKNPEDEPRAR